MVQLHHHTSSFHVPSILQLEIFPGEKQKKGKEINKEKINVHVQCSTSTCLAEIKMSAPLQQLKSNLYLIFKRENFCGFFFVSAVFLSAVSAFLSVDTFANSHRFGFHY
jgi:aspartyl/asparaginyl-tRNA synthetase